MTLPALLILLLQPVFSAEENPETMKKAMIQKLKQDLRKNPVVARQISRHKGAKEFIQEETPPPPDLQEEAAAGGVLPPEDAAQNTPPMPAQQPAAANPTQHAETTQHALQNPAQPEAANPAPPADPAQRGEAPPPAAPMTAHPETAPPAAPQGPAQMEAAAENNPSAAAAKNASTERSLAAEKPQDLKKAAKPDTLSSIESLEEDAYSQESNEEGKDAPSHKVNYKKSALVFYRQKCSGAGGCHKIPVLTNLKSIIFNYNQGRYPPSVISGPKP